MDNLVLVNMISEQVIPAVLPVYHVQGIARLVNLITAENFQEVSARIVRFYSEKLNEIFDGDGAVPADDMMVAYNDWHSTYDVVRELYAKHRQLLINLTGGTKLMAFGAYRAALEHQIPSFYIDSGSNQWIWVVPASPSDYFQIERLSGDMSIRELVELHGGQIRQSMPTPTQFDGRLFQISKLIATDYRIFKGIRAFNSEKYYHREPLQETPKETTVRITWDSEASTTHKPFSESVFLDFITKFTRMGYISSFKKEKSRVMLIDLESDVYSLIRKQGNWLEYYIYSLLAREREQRNIYDLKMGITIEWEGQGAVTVNEADVVVSIHRQLYFISCKTGKLKGGNGTSALDQLVSVAPRMGGMFTKKILVGMHDVTADLRARAELLKIHLVSLQELTSSKNPVSILLGIHS